MELPNSLRSRQGESFYQVARLEGNLEPLDKAEAIREWDRWKLIPNRFPYDSVFEKHDMLIAMDGQKQVDDEVQQIINSLDDYDIWFVNYPHKRSVPAIFHIHLAKYKQRNER